MPSFYKDAETIFQQVDRLNIGLKKATDNSVDLNVALPLSLGVLSAVTIGLEAGTPIWLTLALSAFHSFVSLHTTRRLPQPAQRTDEVKARAAGERTAADS